MRSSKKRSIYLVTTIGLLLPSALIAACSSDDTGTPPVTLLDGAATGAKVPEGSTRPDSAIAHGDSGNNGTGGDAGLDATSTDAATDASEDAHAEAGPEAGPEAGSEGGAEGGADAGPDANTPDGSAPTTLDNGTFVITAWTCTHTGGAKDIKAYADTTLGIKKVRTVISSGGSTATVSSVYNETPGSACARSSVVALTYPMAGKTTTTNAAAYTCTATCMPAQCTSGTQAIETSNYAFTKSGSGFVYTRTLAAGDPADVSVPRLAGCVNGDVETVTETLE